MAWVYLFLASIAEVCFNSALRLSDDFRNLYAAAAFLVGVAVSLVFLQLAQRHIPLGTAYAVWSGIGAVGTVVLGIQFFGEPASLMRILLVIGIVACVAGLKATSGGGLKCPGPTDADTGGALNRGPDRVLRCPFAAGYERPRRTLRLAQGAEKSSSLASIAET